MRELLAEGYRFSDIARFVHCDVRVVSRVARDVGVRRGSRPIPDSGLYQLIDCDVTLRADPDYQTDVPSFVEAALRIEYDIPDHATCIRIGDQYRFTWTGHRNITFEEEQAA